MRKMRILAVNTGSSSIKLDTVVIDERSVSVLQRGRHHLDEADPGTLLNRQLATGTPEAVVHRIVHGGDLHSSALVDDAVEAEIAALTNLAPLHNPRALHWLRLCRRRLDVPQIAVFDTAFFASLPAVARSYAIPPRLADSQRIRRYGFHGIAHRAMWRRWCALHPELPNGGRLITIQLGGGCSIAAILRGAPLDTSMGFSPAEGLVMATRCGDIDPGVMVHLARAADMPPERLERLINTESGLLGLSGRSADLRDLIEDDAPASRLAVDLYCYRLRKYIGAYQAVLGQADGIVFGGGVGEHMPQVRAAALADMQWCGVELDTAANRHARGDEARISVAGGRVEVWAIPVDETAILAEEAYRVLRERA